MDSSRPSQTPTAVKILHCRRAPAISIEDLAENARYTRLRDPLTNTQSSLADIRTNLNGPQLSDANTRKLFGSIRRSVLDAIWQHRNLEEWIFRCTRMGSEYAQAVDGTGSDWSRVYFYSHQDFHLKMEGGARWEVVEMILQHVEVYREAAQGIQRLQSEKERLLEAEKDAAAGRIAG
jgi:small-conductance mechanosensitive channel